MLLGVSGTSDAGEDGQKADETEQADASPSYGAQDASLMVDNVSFCHLFYLQKWLGRQKVSRRVQFDELLLSTLGVARLTNG